MNVREIKKIVQYGLGARSYEFLLMGGVSMTFVIIDSSQVSSVIEMVKSGISQSDIEDFLKL